VLLSGLVAYVVSHFPRFWRFVSRRPILRRWVNRFFIKWIASSEVPRPYPFSLWGPKADVATYSSWTGLTDRTFTGRHLPPADTTYAARLPDLDRLRPLFVRNEFRPCPKSTTLFALFAQWFTDSFLRTDPNDFRKNTSNHEIDLCQIYGLSNSDTQLLRSPKDGKLRSIRINGFEFPDRIMNDQFRVKEQYRGLSYVKNDDYTPGLLPPFADRPERRKDLFLSGLDRGNSTIVYSALNTIFMREHNRLCDLIKKANSTWDDDRVFETARNTNIVCLLQIIICDYINHLSTAQFRVYLDRAIAEQCRWYRTNRISAEFDLLYRWHPLAPTTFDGLPDEEFRYNNALLIDRGVEWVLEQASKQSAGRITLHNTAPFLIDAELAALQKARKWRIAPYNDYRKRFGLRPVSSFKELTADEALAIELSRLYRNVDDLEFTIGLLAETRPGNAVLGELMTLMVGVDAFTQALTNPLLSANVFCEDCFSSAGMTAILQTTDLQGLVRRNAHKNSVVSFTKYWNCT
jgi:prostaglandin-endoperoxide synthase 2